MNTAAKVPRLALLISGLGLGGVQRTMLTLAGGLADRGLAVDLLVPDDRGPFRRLIPANVRLVNLSRWWLRVPVIRARKRRKALLMAPAIADYLRRERPDALLSASHYVNLAALWGRELAGTGTRLVISQRTQLSVAITNSKLPLLRRRPLLAWMTRRYYPRADAIVAVSDGVADDLAEVAHLPRPRVVTVYNPTDLAYIATRAAEPAPHLWLEDGGAPVIVAVGRLAAQKDFTTLLRAFAQMKATRPARLLILGEGRLRPQLEALARELAISDVVALPGYAENPFAALARAQLFVLSSRYEGLPGALIQALACGCAVVSTDCPSGPLEILDHGRYGRLVPVGDADALAAAMHATLDETPDPDRQHARAAYFSVDRAVDAYLDLMLDERAAAFKRTAA
ncbi:glycosyltransferase [Immundisolibacter sp.]|uniref:glycosyltransferase n=1 Tax=Immundisolibacter sp. TaxID=1934948 RepID=UPI00356688A9